MHGNRQGMSNLSHNIACEDRSTQEQKLLRELRSPWLVRPVPAIATYKRPAFGTVSGGVSGSLLRRRRTGGAPRTPSPAALGCAMARHPQR